MSKQIHIPEEIKFMIESFERAKAIEQDAKELAELVKAKKIKEDSETQLRELLEKVEHLIPAFIFPYLIPSFESDLNIEWWKRMLVFHVPGLAPIAMFFTGIIRDDEKPKVDSWCVAGVADLDWDEDIDLCRTAGFSFSTIDKVDADISNIYELLWVAKKSFEDKEVRQIELDQAIVRYHKRIEKQEKEKAHQVSEEQALFDAIKNDPIAIHMLKAFILLRDERSAFEQRLEEMGEEMYSIENHYSRKAADLRRQADEAERRASEKESNLRSLQNDLDDTEEKLKKAQRGW